MAMNSGHHCWHQIAKKDAYFRHLNAQGVAARTPVDALIQLSNQIAKMDACSLQLTVHRKAARTTVDSNWIAKMGAYSPGLPVRRKSGILSAADSELQLSNRIDTCFLRLIVKTKAAAKMDTAH